MKVYILNKTCMSDSEADSYLEEWKFAEKVRARRNVPGGHPFR